MIDFVIEIILSATYPTKYTPILVERCFLWKDRCCRSSEPQSPSPGRAFIVSLLYWVQLPLRHSPHARLRLSFQPSSISPVGFGRNFQIPSREEAWEC